MKYLLVTLVLISSFPAYSREQTFNGSAGYVNYEPIDFSGLEQLGVERAAEQDGQQKCEAAGANNCVIVDSSITACNYYSPRIGFMGYGCDATAIVRGIYQGKDAKPQTPVSAKSGSAQSEISAN